MAGKALAESLIPQEDWVPIELGFQLFMNGDSFGSRGAPAAALTADGPAAAISENEIQS